MESSRRRAVENYRTRMKRRGLARFEVLGRDTDRDLIRSLARRLAENTAEAARLRVLVGQAVVAETAADKGGVLAALRRSPAVGAGLDLARPRVEEREVDL